MINKETRIFHAHAQDPCALHALPRSFHAQARTATLILPCPCLEEVKEVSINTRSSRRKNDPPVSDVNETNEHPTTSDEIHEEDSSDAYWGAMNPPPNVLIYMEDDQSREWVKGYQEDPHLVKIWEDSKSLAKNWTPGH